MGLSGGDVGGCGGWVVGDGESGHGVESRLRWVRPWATGGAQVWLSRTLPWATGGAERRGAGEGELIFGGDVSSILGLVRVARLTHA